MVTLHKPDDSLTRYSEFSKLTITGSVRVLPVPKNKGDLTYSSQITCITVYTHISGV